VNAEILYRKTYDMKTFTYLSFLLCTIGMMGQQKLTLQDCERQFLDKNLMLLASHYNIDQAQAAVLQSKIWDLPQIGGEVNAWAPNNDQKFFNAGKEGQKAAYIQQVIKIGGQRKNQIELAKSNAAITQLDFDQLLRDLKFQLRTAFFAIYFDTQSIAEIDKQRDNLKTLIDAYSVQTQKGNVSLKDLVRLQNLYLSLKSDRNALMTEILNNKNVLITLLNSNDINLTPAPTLTRIGSLSSRIALPTGTVATNGFDQPPRCFAQSKSIGSRQLEHQITKVACLTIDYFGRSL